MGEVGGQWDEDVEREEKAEYDQALATLDGRTAEVLAGIMAPGKGEMTGVDGVSVEICRVNTAIAPRGDAGGAGREMRTALAHAGITAPVLADCLKEGLTACKRVYMAGTVRRVPDYAVRLRYLDLAHRLRGDVQQGVAVQQDSLTYEQRIMAVARRIADKT